MVVAKLPVPDPVTLPVSVIVWSPLFEPLMVALPAKVNVRAASPITTVNVRVAVRTSEDANFRSKAAPVERTPKDVRALITPPAIVGAVSTTNLVPVPV